MIAWSWLMGIGCKGVRQRESVKHHRYSTVCAATPDLAGGRQKVAPLTIKDAKIVAEPPRDGKLKIRVDVDGQATKRAFDTVLKDLARHAPPVPGFRKAKGGKTSIVPLNVIYQLMGPKLVRKFVIEEILKATLNDYVQKEGIKVKNELKTDQSSDQLDAEFEPGKEFGFDATLDLADEQTKDSVNNEAMDEMEIQS
jgi:FKBP-type peptidyl-prolyl cis-trans isomerase (trigger factor)